MCCLAPRIGDKRSMARAAAATDSPAVLPSRRDWLRIGVPAAARRRALGAAPKPSPARRRGSAARSRSSSSSPAAGRASSTRGTRSRTPRKRSAARSAPSRPQCPACASASTCRGWPRWRTATPSSESMTHDDLDHGSACYLALTGQFHPRKSSNPPPRPTDFPALGAVLKRVPPGEALPAHRGPRQRPAARAEGGRRRGSTAGSSAARTSRPNSATSPTPTGSLESLDLPAGRARGPARRRAATCSAKLDPRRDAPTRSRRQAFELVNAPQVRAAFDLDREPDEAPRPLRAAPLRAGVPDGAPAGRGGVPWVTVFFNHGIRGQDDHPDDTDEYGWDTHNDIFDVAEDAPAAAVRPQRLGAASKTCTQRGLLDTTLVVVHGRVRPGAAGGDREELRGRGRRGGSTGRRATRWCSPGRGSRRGGVRRVGPHRGVPAGRARRRRATSRRRCSTPSASPPTPTTPTPPTARIARSPATRSRSCSE